MFNLDKFEAIFEKREGEFVADWKRFLQFKSISTDPNFRDDTISCAKWLASHLESIGLQSKLLETPSLPTVFAEYKGPSGSPTLLFYGHYDVQPPDPLDAWKTPPFEPTLRDGRIYARGAQDNKGQVTYFIKAVQSLIEAGALHCTLRLFIEGEEESGSGGIAKAHKSWPELKGDALIVCDTGVVPSGNLTITMGLRGIVTLTVKLFGANYDLHSGVHGGLSQNAALEMARLLSTLHDSNGKIAVEGFYDDVVLPEKNDRKLANDVPFKQELYKQLTGFEARGGEKDFTPWERNGFRPTVEINGIHSGYGGAGSKTIIPCEATAKISIRVVANQDPAKTLEQIEAHLKAHAPNGMRLEISDQSIGGPALLLSAESKRIQLAREVLSELSDKPAVYRWEGASIPIVSALARHSGAEPILVGFGMEEDRIHAPNESFSIEQFRTGFLYSSLLLSRLSNLNINQKLV